MRIATDPATFSNGVSRFLQVPNGLDGAEHARFRSLIDRYFTPEAMTEFAPGCALVARNLVADLPRERAIDAVWEVGARYAVRAQSAWLGWSADLEPRLLEWLEDKLEATRTGDAVRNDEVARRFDAMMLSLIESRRASDGSRDLTDRLIHDTLAGRPLRDDEIVSILRNWTGGDLGTIALSIGVIVHFIATHPEIAAMLGRETSDERFDACLEEILRIDDPFPASRRVATCPADMGSQRVEAGQRIHLDWRNANRDPRVFSDAFDPERHAPANLVYGVGPHVCPGRPLARIELREIVRALLAPTSEIVLAGEPVREMPPLGGFRSVPIRLAT